MRIYIALVIVLFFVQPLHAQKYERNTDLYSFKYENEKLNLVFNESILAPYSNICSANNEIILMYNKWVNAWTPIIDGKIGDSIVDFSESRHLLRDAIAFYKRGNNLYVSENIFINEGESYTIDPNTGGDMVLVDENGNPVYKHSTSGGYFEMYSLKDSKKIVAEEGSAMLHFYGNKALTYFANFDVNDDYISTYTLYDEKGTPIFEKKSMDEIYAADNLLKHLVSNSSAEKIVLKSKGILFEHFAFIQNGKMGYSSINGGVIKNQLKIF